MAREPLERLADELSTVVNDIDAALAERFAEPHRYVRNRRREETRHGEPLRGLIVAALRWLRLHR